MISATDCRETSMKQLIVFVGMSVACAVAAASGSSEHTGSALIGTWAVDIARLPIPPAARPQQVTISFSDAGAGRRRMLVDIVDAAGRETKAQSTYALDGLPVPVSGSPEADTGALKSPSPDVLILALTKGGVGASTRVYAAQP